MVMPKSQMGEAKSPSPWENLKETARSEFEQKQRELKEIDLMIEQSLLEVNKVTQRNRAITEHLQLVQAQFDSMPRTDIRSAYDAALDAQQRLSVMRGQLEKLQSDRVLIGNYQALLEKTLRVLEGETPVVGRGKTVSSTTQTVEMMIQAQEAERQRLARQMHDGPAQALSNFILQTEIALRLFDIDPVKAKEELATMKAAATSTFQRVRDFITDLRPMMLDDLGLTPTLTRYIESQKEQSSLDIRLSVAGMEQRLESYLEVMIFRAIQELLGNAIRHSQAPQIRVTIDANDLDVHVTVEDTGKGFDVATVGEKGGMGLKIIRERVEMLGGTFDMDSNIGQGTRIAFHIPATKTKVFA